MNRSDRKPLEENLAGFEIATPEIIDFQSTMFKTEELKPLFSTRVLSTLAGAKKWGVQLRIGLLVSVASGSIAGCQTPNWWAYRSLQCIPPTADNVATEYLKTCGESSLPPSEPSASSDPLKLPAELPGTQAADLIAPMRQKLDPLAFIMLGGPPQEFVNRVRDDIAAWSKVVAAGNIRIEE